MTRDKGSVPSEIVRHSVQVKISVDSSIAAAFKDACRVSNMSMASVLSQCMKDFSNVVSEKSKNGYAPDLSDRRKRRIATRTLIKQLTRVMESEQNYISNIPENLQGSEAFERADLCVSLLAEAIELLQEAY